MTKKRKDKSDKTSERIMAAARTVFAQKRYNGARIDEIAARANVNKATIYYQIGDKETLYAGALHQVIGHVARDIADAVSRKAHPEEKMKAYITFIADAVEANPDLPPMMMQRSQYRAQRDEYLSGIRGKENALREAKSELSTYKNEIVRLRDLLAMSQEDEKRDGLPGEAGHDRHRRNQRREAPGPRILPLPGNQIP